MTPMQTMYIIVTLVCLVHSILSCLPRTKITPDAGMTSGIVLIVLGVMFPIIFA